MNLRFANKPTVLPRGGGPDGKSPVLLPKGSGIAWSVYHLHRLESIYGPEARVYRPQRWESGELIKKARPGAGYVDFHGGPRLCLGSKRTLSCSLFVSPLTLHRGFRTDGSKLRRNQNSSGVSQHSACPWNLQRTCRSRKADVHYRIISCGWRTCGIDVGTAVDV
jgi:hypothetical protein